MIAPARNHREPELLSPLRVCRFALGDDVLLGLYRDEGVIPIDAAFEAMGEDTGRDLNSACGDDLLDLLPPDGRCLGAIRSLVGWIERLEPVDLQALLISHDDIRLLVPIPRPAKLLLLAGNYAKHVEERGGVAAEKAETFPYVFWKPPTTTLTNPDEPIVLPRVSPDHMDWECELGVIIGSECKGVSEDEALDYVAGYTVVNDVSDRKFAPNPDRKPRDRDKFFDWLHGKWHDASCPMGPCVLSAQGVDPQNLAITLKVNGEIKQDASTAQMVFPVAAVIAFVSSFVTLEPGDILSTGTPSGVGSATGTYLKAGDRVEAAIAGIGILRNPVVAG